jgi:hypothetical protein
VRYCSTGAADDAGVWSDNLGGKASHPDCRAARGSPTPDGARHSDAHEHGGQCAHEIGGDHLCTSAHAFKLRLAHRDQHAQRHDATAVQTIICQAKEQNDDAITE